MLWETEKIDEWHRLRKVPLPMTPERYIGLLKEIECYDAWVPWRCFTDKEPKNETLLQVLIKLLTSRTARNLPSFIFCPVMHTRAWFRSHGPRSLREFSANEVGELASRMSAGVFLVF